MLRGPNFTNGGAGVCVCVCGAHVTLVNVSPALLSSCALSSLLELDFANIEIVCNQREAERALWSDS